MSAYQKETASTKNKRIAKNTLFLYFRMLIIICVSLYTSRIVLKALGVTDYGIYNVVGGFVAMFTLLSGSISAAISRYLTYELSTGNQERLQNIFSTSLNILIIISIIILLIAETGGIWFVNKVMEIPENRIVSANWVFQLSLVTFIIKLISQPYNAAIISHEKMSAFAYISIIEALGNLTIAYLVCIYNSNSLVLYAILMCILSIIIRVFYTIYCKKNFIECIYKRVIDLPLLKEMFSFAGWNFIGASSAMLRDQGGNILINVFFGAAVNAATGIATQVNHAVYGFVTNFMTALNPQITKSYASGDYKYMFSLIFRGSRFAFFLLMLIATPILLNTEYVLSIWLTTIPDYTSIFIQLTLIFALSEAISQPLVTAMLANGNIRNYQIIVGGLQMLNLPISYIFLHFHYPPQIVYIISIIISQCCLCARIIMLRGMISLNVKKFLSDVYLRVILVSFFTFVPIIICNYKSTSFFDFIIYCIIIIFWTASIIVLLGVTRKERIMILNKILNKIKNDKH